MRTRSKSLLFHQCCEAALVLGKLSPVVQFCFFSRQTIGCHITSALRRCSFKVGNGARRPRRTSHGCRKTAPPKKNFKVYRFITLWRENRLVYRSLVTPSVPLISCQPRDPHSQIVPNSYPMFGSNGEPEHKDTNRPVFTTKTLRFIFKS